MSMADAARSTALLLGCPHDMCQEAVLCDGVCTAAQPPAPQEQPVAKQPMGPCRFIWYALHGKPASCKVAEDMLGTFQAPDGSKANAPVMLQEHKLPAEHWELPLQELAVLYPLKRK